MRLLLVLLALCSCGAPLHAAVVALVQYDADRHYGDYRTNMDNLMALATEAVAAGATTIVLPEGSAYGYSGEGRLWCRPGMATYQGQRCDDVGEVAESVPGGATGLVWGDFARRHGVQVFYAVMERDGASYFNTVAVVDAQGYIGRYRKRSLYWVDEAYAEPGEDPLIVTVGGRQVGVLICMDANYDALYRGYRAAGASDVIVPMDWDQSPDGERAGRIFLRSQARRNRMNLFVSDQATWDSTGYYPSGGSERARAPLPAVAPGVDGLVLQALADD
jgi:predicted amidohydrolase